MPDARTIIRFRIYPESRTLHFLVNVWPNRQDVICRARDTYGLTPDDEKLQAYVSPRRVYRVHADGRKRLKPYCGEINFYRENIGAGIVAHEMGHAMLEWCKRIGHVIEEASFDSPKVSDSEERACIVLGELVRQFYCHAQRLRLY